MPSNSTVSQAKALPSKEINQGGTSTAEAQFIQAAVTTPLICYFPGSDKLNNKLFRILAAGRCIAGTGTPNFTASMDVGTSATIASNTTIASTGAVAIATTQGNWGLIVEAYWDTVSNRIQGLQKGWVYATALAQIILTAVVTVDLSVEGSGLTVTGTFSAGNAANAAYVDVFEITLL